MLKVRLYNMQDEVDQYMELYLSNQVGFFRVASILDLIIGQQKKKSILLGVGI